MRYEVNYTDNSTGATSAIEVIDVEEGYTAEDYIRDCQENADDEWNEMLANGTVELVKADYSYHVVMNIKSEPWQTDTLLETNDSQEAIDFARSMNNKDVEIWTNITESSYDTIEY